MLKNKPEQMKQFIIEHKEDIIKEANLGLKKINESLYPFSKLDPDALFELREVLSELDPDLLSVFFLRKMKVLKMVLFEKLREEGLTSDSRYFSLCHILNPDFYKDME